MTKVAITTTANGITETNWLGEYRAGPVLAEPAILCVHDDGDDASPHFLENEEGTVRELTRAEGDVLCEGGAVEHMTYRHPRADKYGYPICAANEPALWAGTCGNFGFRPSANLELVCEDTGDDSPDACTFRIAVSKNTAEAIDKVTKEAIAAFGTALNLDDEEAAVALSRATDDLAATDTVELEGRLEELEEDFGKAGGRGVEMADEIDALRGFLAARKVIEHL